MSGHAVVIAWPGRNLDLVEIEKEMIFEQVTTQCYFLLSAAFWSSPKEMTAAALHLRRPLEPTCPENYF